MKRHIAKMANTDQRIVVVFMQIPNREDHALIVATDNLPPRWEQHIMQVVESPEGQSDPDLGNVLSRRFMPDSTDTVLQALHKAGLLEAVSIDRVIMFPEPNRPYALRQILQAMNRVVPDEYEIVDRLNESAPVADPYAPPMAPLPTSQPIPSPEAKFNPHTTNQSASVSEGNVEIARGLLFEAELLENDAKTKRERAYTYAPHLRPAAPKKSMVSANQIAANAKAAAQITTDAKAKRSTPTRKRVAKA